MKWLVKFRSQQHQCCPDLYYWVAHTQEVEAPNEAQARAQILESWRWRGPIEVKTVEKISD
jgi:hypothetical protein